MQVSLNGVLCSAVGGAASIEVEARTLQELFDRILARYPAMQDHVDRGVAVAIDGVVYRDDWTQSIPADAREVYLMPRIEGG